MGRHPDAITIITFPEEQYRGFSILKLGQWYAVYRTGERQMLWQDLTLTDCRRWIDGQIRPKAGDLVQIHNPQDCLIEEGAYGVIDGTEGVIPDDFLVVFNCYSCFFGKNTKHSKGPRYVSGSGGPAFRIKRSQLDATGRTDERWFWRWKDYPRADGGVRFKETVRVWSYTRPKKVVG